MKSTRLITHPNFTLEKPTLYFDNLHYQTINDPFEPVQGLLNAKKTFSIDKSNVKKVIIRATALGVFDMFLNGNRVGADKDGYADEYKPGWTDYRIRVYEYEYDVTDLCDKENLFVAEVSEGWWSGRISFNMYGARPLAFAAEIEIENKDGSKEIIGSDETWETCIGGPVQRASIWDGEYYDSTIPRPSISPEKYNWEKAVKYEYEGQILKKVGPSVRVKKDLCRRPYSAVKYHGTIDNGTTYGEINAIDKKVGTNCEKNVLKAGEVLLMDMGQEIVGRPVIEVKAPHGTKVKIHIAEMLNDSGEEERGNDGPKGSIYVKNYRTALARALYVASGNDVEKYYPTHSFYGFRYVHIMADADIEILSVLGQVIGSEIEETGTFECDHPEVNQLYSNVVWGMRGNYFSIPTDCPQRDERLGWTGDTQMFCGTAAYLGNIQDFMHKWLYDLSDTQIGGNGAYGDFAPLVMPWRGNSAWGDAGLVVPHRIWLMYNDKEILERQFDSMEWYMNYLSQFGLEGPGINYGDWLNYEDTDKRYIAICFYAKDAELMAKFCKILGKAEKAAHYEKLRADIQKHWETRYVKDGKIAVTSQAGYILPLAFDLVEGELKENCIKALEKKIIDNNYTLSTGFVGTVLLNKTLEKVGLSHIAYSLLLQTTDPSWLYSVKQGATTIWERWNSYTLATGFGDVSMNSFNHYAYGAVAEWFYSGICGILPDENAPGFKHFFLKPSPDMRDFIPEGQQRINSAKATYKSVSGVIESGWSKINDSYVYSFTIPEGTTATVKLIAKDIITINGVDMTLDELKGKKCSCDRAVFDLGAGTYKIVIKS